MNRYVAILSILWLITSTGVNHGQVPECDKVVDYRITAVLDPETKIVTGSQILQWKNTSERPVSSLLFHAYLNAFKNSRSTFFLEAQRGLARRSRVLFDRPDDSWGYLEVKSIRATCENAFADSDVMSTFSYIQPDDGNEADETVFEIVLSKAIPPGASVVLNMEFTAKLPSEVPRTGFRGDYFLVAQWFPKIGVLEENRWICNQFHTNSEFYADYGDYDVTLTVPRNFVVGSSGILVDSTANADGTNTLRFVQRCIHDFAWTAFPRYKVAERMFEYPDLPPVKMRLLYQPEHKKYVEEFFSATSNTLKHYGIWYIPYPYEQITIVDALWRSWSAGMEYPCLFTTAVDWLTPGRSLDPEFLTVHECGHQFWYGLVGNDEIRYPWLDEGINSYADTRCLNAAYGADVYVKDYLSRAGFSIPIAFSAVRLDQRTRRLNRFRRTLGGDPMNLPTWEYRNGDSYGNNAYDKPALLLWTLESVLGEQVFSDIMKTYAERYSFKHPAPRDFIDVIDEYSEEPIDWLFDQLFDGPGVLDYAVVKLDRKTIKGPSGFFTEAEGIEFRKPTENKENTIQTTIVLERRGDLKIPVDIHIRFADGETAIERWDGADVWKRLVYVRDVEVERVDIDPERKLVLDVDYANNSMYGKKEPYAALKWALRWMFWLQHFFEVAAFFS